MSDTYSPPDSNPDPYSNPSSSPSFDTSNLPRPPPFPFLGSLTGYTPTRLTEFIQKRLDTVSQQISRPLTPDEAAALAHHSARAIQIASLGPPLGIGIGAYRTWTTRKEFRWPLYGKIISDEVGTGFWDGEKMRMNGKEILAGVSREGKAGILHVARGGAYVSLGMLIMPWVLSSYAAAWASVSELRDQRLKAVVKGLAAAAQTQRDERVAKIRGQRGEATTSPNAAGQRGDVWKERRERRERMGGRVERQEEGVDDMSPTGGAMLDYGLDDSQGETGVMSDSQLQSQASPSPSPFQKRQPQSARSTPSPSYDDASPTAGRGMLDDTFPSSSSSSSDTTGLSAWERIRQQNASETTSPPSPSPSSSTRQRRRGQQQQQQRQEEGGDGFTFSSEEEERGYARAEAQKEFDERLERERRGGSFGGN